MPKQICLVCATDEGLFLDVFTHGFADIIDNCLSLEVKRSKTSPTKICYKCAYELHECNKFIEKFNQVHKSPKRKLPVKRGHCNLCSEIGKKGFIYELKNGNLHGVFQQIEELFEKDLSNNKSLSVCLYCRYNLDVLSDLRKVSSNKAIDEILPVVNVNVIKRKTTSLSSSSMASSTTSTTSSNKDSPKNKKVKNKNVGSSSPERQCSECDVKVKNGQDMFRLHTTGKTMCKVCWGKVESSKGKATSTSKKTDKTSTKPCAVFLKDVLSNQPTTRSTRKLGQDKDMTKETDSDGNVIYIISDDSDAEIASPKGKIKRTNSETSTKLTKRRKTMPSQCDPSADNALTTVNTSTRTSARIGSKRKGSGDFEMPNIELKKSKTKKGGSKSENDKKQVAKQTRASSVKPVGSPKKPMPAKSLSSGDEASQPKRGAVKSRTDSRSSSSSRSSSLSWQKEKNDDEGTEKSEKKTKKTEAESSESVVLPEADGKNSQPYTCTSCNTEFRTRVEGKAHELTHSKTLELVLKKVSIFEAMKEEEKKKEEATADIDASDDETIDDIEASANAKAKDSVEVDDKSDAKASIVDEKAEKQIKVDGEAFKEKKAPERKDDETSSEDKVDKMADEDKKEAVAEEKDNDDDDDDDETTASKDDEVLSDQKEKSEALLQDEEKTVEKVDTEVHNEEKEEEEKNDKNESEEEKEDEKKEDKKEEEVADRDYSILNENTDETLEESAKKSEKPEDKAHNDSPAGSQADEDEKNDEAALTNGENIASPRLTASKDQNDDKASDKSQDNENANDTSKDEVDKESENVQDEVKDKDGVDTFLEKTAEEANEDDDYESDEEKSPEPEPLSPPPSQAQRDDEDCYRGRLDPNEDKKESITGNTDVEKNEEATLVEEKALETNGKTKEAIENSKNDDEASMDAIEREMETIVGDNDNGKKFKATIPTVQVKQAS